MTKSLLAIDQGTTSSRAIVFDRSGCAVGTAQQEFPQLFPSPGHVEHDPEAIWESQLATSRAALTNAKRSAADRLEVSRYLFPANACTLCPPDGRHAGTPHIRANETATFTVNDLTPGAYLFWCSVEAANGNHASFGMVGTLTITP